MKKILALLLLVLISFKPAQAQVASPWLKQMSAEQSIALPDGKVVTSKIYVDNGNVRVDINAAGMDMSTIMLSDKKTMYTIMHNQKMAVEIPMTSQDQDRVMAFDASNLKFEPIGTEMLQGVECQKYRLVYATGRAQIFWINKQTQAPVQMAAEDGSMRIDWHNVVAGPQPAALFVPPAEYKITKMPTLSAPGVAVQ